MMGEYKLTSGAISTIMDGGTVESPTFQVLGYKKISGQGGGDRFRLNISDGIHSHSFAMLATQINNYVPDGKLENGAVIQVNKLISNAVNGKRVLIILELTVLTPIGAVQPKLGNPVQWTEQNTKLGSTAAMNGGGNNNNNNNSNAMPKPAAPRNPAPQNQSNTASRNTSASAGMPPTPTSHIPISDLTPYNSQCTIRGRITNKTPVKTWSNSKGEGKLFSFNILDETSEVRGSAFNAQVDKFYDMLEMNQVFYISRFNIKVSNKQWNTLPHDYEISLTENTMIYPYLESANDIPMITFDFKKIDSIANEPEGSIVDVIGICKSFGEINRFTAKTTGKELVKRDVVLVDQSNAEISLTLWGNKAEEYDDDSQPVIAVKGAKVSDFGGKSLSLLMASNFEKNPDIAEAHQLRGWFDNGGSNAPTTSLSGTGGRGAFNTPWKVLKEANSLSPNEEPEKGDYYMTKVTIMAIRKENIVYKACSNPNCNKKILDQNDGTFRCEKCNTNNTDFRWRLMLQVCFGDFSDNVWATCFEETGEIIMGKSSAEIGPILFDQERADEHEALIKAPLFRSYIVKFRSKFETYNDEKRRKITVLNLQKIDYKDYAQKLLNEMREL